MNAADKTFLSTKMHIDLIGPNNIRRKEQPDLVCKDMTMSDKRSDTAANTAEPP